MPQTPPAASSHPEESRTPDRGTHHDARRRTSGETKPAPSPLVDQTHRGRPPEAAQMRPRPRPAGPDLGPPPPPMATGTPSQGRAGQPEAPPPLHRRCVFTTPWSGHRAAAQDDEHVAPRRPRRPAPPQPRGGERSPPPPEPRAFARRRPLATVREGRGEEGLEVGGDERFALCSRERQDETLPQPSVSVQPLARQFS
nr:uncharacterized protein LOC127337866 [Lolium perenne]